MLRCPLSGLVTASHPPQVEKLKEMLLQKDTDHTKALTSHVMQVGVCRVGRGLPSRWAGLQGLS